MATRAPDGRGNDFFEPPKQFGERIGASHATTYRLMKKGLIVSVKIGGMRRINVPRSLEMLAAASAA